MIPAFAVALLLAAAPLGAQPPALIVVISVDQMRADYLVRFSKEFTGGFARLLKEGAVFRHARHAHVPTETSPGHAALMTGCFPAEHGIVGNEWWDRTEARMIYAVEDPEHGRSPVNLRCPALGDALKAAHSDSRVISVSYKDRAAVLMGGQRPNIAVWYDRQAGQFVSSGYYGRLPDWVWNWDAQLKIPADQRDTIAFTPRMDEMTLAFATEAISRENLGGRGVPDLLAVGLSVTDLVGHRHGPDGEEMHAQIVALDKSLGTFISGLDARFGRGGYALALSSDHGVSPIPETSRGRTVRVAPEKLLERLEKNLRDPFGAPPKAGARWALDIHSPYVYLDLAGAVEAKIDPDELRAEAARALRSEPAVSRVYLPSRLAGKADEADYAAEFRRSYDPERSGDVLILFKTGSVISDAESGTVHGLPYADDADIPMLLMGSGIKPGRYDREALATDLAPTLGRVLELDFPPHSPSRVLTEALVVPDRGAKPAVRADGKGA